MEEILASIRRIISEDAGPAAFASEPARKPATVAAPPPPPPPVRPVDFGLLPMPPFATASRPTASVTASAPRPVAVAPPLPPVAAAADDDDILDLDASYAAVTRRPPSEAAAPAPTLALVREAKVAEPPQTLREAAPELVETAPLDELLQPDPDPMPEPAAIVFEAAHAAAVEPPPPVPEPVQALPLDISEPVRAEPAVVAAPPLAEGAGATGFVAEPAVVADLNSPPPVSPALAGMLAEPLPAASPAALTPAAAMAETVVQTAPQMAAAPGLADLAPVGVAAPITAVAAATAVVAPPPIVAAQATARTMEDMVAEMLRPMLREWLDSNMPRIIEKTFAKPGE